MDRMMQKWPSKSKEQQAARVRNNQRRHRARIKDYIASLEEQLSEVRARLDEALADNSSLASELSRLRADSTLRSVPPGVGQAAEVDARTSDFDGRAAHLSGNGQKRDEEPRDHAPLLTMNAAADPAPVSCRTTPTQEEDQCFAALASKCSQLPPPRPGESTIVCEEAYVMIKQQNIYGISLDAIEEYLKPGFRGPNCRGGGCRVDSTRVFSAIDSVSSSVPLVSSSSSSCMIQCSNQSNRPEIVEFRRAS